MRLRSRRRCCGHRVSRGRTRTSSASARRPPPPAPRPNPLAAPPPPPILEIAKTSQSQTFSFFLLPLGIRIDADVNLTTVCLLRKFSLICGSQTRASETSFKIQRRFLVLFLFDLFLRRFNNRVTSCCSVRDPSFKNASIVL